MLTKTMIVTAALATCFGLTACDRSVNATDSAPTTTAPAADGSEWTERGGALREEIARAEREITEGEALPPLPEGARCAPIPDDLVCALVLPGEPGYDDALSPYHP